MSRSTPRRSVGRSGEAVDQRRLDGHRPQVGVQAEAAAQREERLLGTDGGRRIVPLGAADGAQVDGIGGGADGQVLVADRDAVVVDGPSTDHQLAPLDGEAHARRRRHRAPADRPR